VLLLATVAFTTAVWVAVTFLTRPTDADTLRRFYRVARPAGPGWRAVRAETPEGSGADDLGQALTGWLAGIALVYGALFGAGHLLLGHTLAGAIALAIAFTGAAGLSRVLSRLWSSGAAGSDSRR
jgi:hypothetical protein